MKKNKFTLSDEEHALFRDSVRGIKPLRQDKALHRIKPKVKKRPVERLLQEQMDASFYFSDEFQPLLSEDSPIRYVRPGANSYEVKKLRRGDYSPELFLDLHGLTQLEAKQELGALIAACRREHVHCACIMHGYGTYVLKQQTPLWLAQHPDVMAFHQAPKEFGGNAAILVLIAQETSEDPTPF
ncbi:endonuclease SmrB [Budviciaceae bacterium CWB-B4]|uniref:Ribosome rescue factor SmrB n=1 Tax=Limnobaculum xujianqingii TaxID=2738837 RepID=A0A9D7AGC0_9GAMM|nr:endonuclease SmrB [Limnobaculum xujianqingii]MBK5072262.1 endonuclease SmrB [Limnobaculum xujianqingii]MBK5175571.1 endonuclease SmrB [Limnobaculum xujianqingii]